MTATTLNDAVARSPLRLRAFRLLALGQFASTAGDQLYAVALPVLMLARPEGSRGLGVLLAVFGVCRICTLPLGGRYADRFDPRRVMLGADVLRVGALITFAILAWRPGARLWELATVAGIVGLGDGCFSPASLAILPRMVPRTSLQSANAIYQAGTQVIGICTPALGGLLISVLGTKTGLAIDAGTFLASVGTLVLIGRGRVPEEPCQPAGKRPNSARTAQPTLWSLMRSDSLLRTFLLAAVAVSLVVGGVLEVGLPVLATGPLHGGSTGYGLLLTGFAVGSLGGALAATRVGKRATGITAVLSICLLGPSLIAVAGVSTLRGPLSIGAVACLGALAGAGPTCGNVLLLSLFQARLPQAALGRVMGTMLAANLGLFPVSALLASVSISGVGVRGYLAVSGVFVTGCLLAALCARSVRTASLADITPGPSEAERESGEPGR